MSARLGVAVLWIWGSLACGEVPCAPGTVRVADSCLTAPGDGGDGGAGSEPGEGGPGAPTDAEAGAADAEPSDADSFTSGQEAGVPPCGEQMVGTYAVRETSFSIGTVLTEQILTTVDYKRVQIRREGDRLLLSAELCYAETIDAAGNPSAVPSDNLAYLGAPDDIPVEVDCEDLTWTLPRTRLTGGWQPGVPEGCEDGAAMSTNAAGVACRCPPPDRVDDVPLSNDADDCRITDDDNDRQPGVTVEASLGGFRGDMYVAYDREGYYAGDIRMERLHTGRWHDEGSESHTLGCHEPDFFGLGCPDPDIAPCTAPVNQMIFVPVDASLTCMGIRYERVERFQPYQPAVVPRTEECLL